MSASDVVTGPGTGDVVAGRQATSPNALIASDRVEGTPVRRSSGEKIGTVERLMIDKVSGKVAYAVMSFGGFLGVGERYHPLPWRMLTYDTGLGGYVVDVTREQLEGGPTYGRGETPWTSNPNFGREVYGHYGQPYGDNI